MSPSRYDVTLNTPYTGSATGHPGWEAGCPEALRGGMAIAVWQSAERTKRVRRAMPALQPVAADARPPGWAPPWRESLLDQVAGVLAARQLPGAAVTTALGVPRFVHGQSQGICDLFGARVEKQDDGNFYVYPLTPDPAAIDAVRPAPLEQSICWGAVEWIRYARLATGGAFEFKNPVMTGPFDTANYLLGTITLMEWVYAEPDALHRLLDKTTSVIIGMLRALRQAAGGILHGDALLCMRNAFCLCSECRSLVSAEVYEEFEAPYLARIGRELGSYGIHSCGSWERTIPSALKDPNLRAMNGQIRENDLELLCRLADGKLLLSIGRSQLLPERYTWPDAESFYSHILRTVPESQPCEIGLPEDDLDLWKRLFRQIRKTNP